MPSPWSATAKRIAPSPFAIETSTRPPSGEYLIALSTRFTSTWRSLPGSAATSCDVVRRPQLEVDRLGQVRARRVEDEPASSTRIAGLDRDGQLAGVEPARDEQVADDRAEPVGLGRDHLEQLVADVRRELDVRRA